MSKIKGDNYEKQIYNYLIENYNSYYSYLWIDVPHKYIEKYILDNIDNIYDDNESNKSVDIGCDILMINKLNDDDFIIVQCKNYLDKNVCIGDLAGFFHLIALSHIPIKGMIISNTLVSDRIKNKLNYIDRVTFLQIPYNEPVIEVCKNDVILRDYQVEAIEQFKTIDKGILQLFCGMGKTLVAINIAKEFKNIIILSPLRNYALQLFNVLKKI